MIAGSSGTKNTFPFISAALKNMLVEWEVSRNSRQEE
jgi:hypothetical protein